MFIFLCLIYFTSHSILQVIHVVANGKILLFFMVELYSNIYICIHTHTTYTYHIYIPCLYPFICWWTLHCTVPWLLWIMLLWTLECMYFFKKVFLFTLDIPRSKTTGSHGRCILFLWGTSVLFSTVTELIYISIGGFTFLHILTKICFLCSFWW